LQAVEELLSKALEQRSVPETGSSSGDGGGGGGGGGGSGGGGPAAADAAIHALEAQVKAEGESLREEISDLRCGNVFLAPFCTQNPIIWPRQARDKQKEKLKQLAFLQRGDH
jgi:hypothetical protein